MQNIKTYILEKFKISSKNIEKLSSIDYENPEDIANIYKAAFISIMKNGSYIEGPTFQKKLTGIRYNDIIDILNNIFEYKNISYDEGKIKKGNIWKIISNDKKAIQNLINLYTIKFKYDKDIELSGVKLAKEYKDIIKNKS